MFNWFKSWYYKNKLRAVIVIIIICVITLGTIIIVILFIYLYKLGVKAFGDLIGYIFSLKFI